MFDTDNAGAVPPPERERKPAKYDWKAAEALAREFKMPPPPPTTAQDRLAEVVNAAAASNIEVLKNIAIAPGVTKGDPALQVVERYRRLCVLALDKPTKPRKVPAKIKPPKKVAKKAKKKPAKKAKKKADKAGAPRREDLRSGSKLAIIDGMLRHPGGCTRAEVMKACDWPSVSMQQQAAALGVELKSSKEQGQPTRYWID